MEFISDKCDCCEDRVLGIAFSTEDVQQAEDGTLVLTFDEDQLSTIYTEMTRALARQA